MDNFDKVFYKFEQIWTNLNNCKHVRTGLILDSFTQVYATFRHVQTGLWKYGSLSLEQDIPKITFKDMIEITYIPNSRFPPKENEINDVKIKNVCTAFLPFYFNGI